MTTAEMQERLDALTHDLSNCPDWKVGTPWWNDRLNKATRIRKALA